MKLPTLSKLLGGIAPSVFAEHYAEKKHLIAKSALTQDEVKELLSVRAVRELFARFPLTESRFQLISDGAPKSGQPVHPAGGVDACHLVERFNGGASIRINNVHELVPEVNRLCASLARECGGGVFANLYMTPRASAGFFPHFDDHDVVILQTHGKKEWSLHRYECVQDLPMRGNVFDAERHREQAVVDTFLLSQGDTLYIPRGHMHSAKTVSDHTSVHITLAVNWISWGEFIFDLMARTAMSNRRFRESVSLAVIRDGQLCETFDNWSKQRLKQLLTAAIDSISVEGAYQEMIDDLASAHFTEHGYRLEL